MAWEKWLGGRCWVAPGVRVYHIFKMRHGRRYSVSTRCNDLRAAIKEYDRWQLDPDSYQPLGSEELTINDDIILYFTEAGRALGNSEGRVNKKKKVMEWWRDEFTKDIRTITPEKVYALVKGKKDPERKKSILKTFLGWLHSTGKTERNLGDGISVTPSQPAQFKKPKLIAKSWHDEVIGVLPQKYADLCIILAGTGWHIEELGRFIEDGSIEYPDERYVLVTPRHKSGDIHKTEVSERVEESAFRAKELGWFNRVLLGRAIKKACIVDLGKKTHYSPSWYRHSVATWAIEKGADPAAVSVFLGHRHPATVKRFYATHAVVPKVPTLE